MRNQNTRTVGLWKDQSGSALMVVLLILLMVTALGTAQMAEALLESRITSNDLSYRQALVAAHSVLNLAVDGLARLGGGARTNAAWTWNSILTGPDGVMESCLLSGFSRLDPVRLFDASASPLGSICNTCGDDGTLQDWITGSWVVGRSGIQIWSVAGGGTRYAQTPEAQSCTGSQSSARSELIAHAWVKVSDNAEPDGNKGVDTDSVTILRVIAAAANLPGDARIAGASSRRNSVATLEAWLKRNSDGSLSVLSIREVTP